MLEKYLLTSDAEFGLCHAVLLDFIMLCCSTLSHYVIENCHVLYIYVMCFVIITVPVIWWGVCCE